MLTDKGHLVDCACYLDKEVDKSLTAKGIKIYNIPFSRKSLEPKNVKAFKKLINI